MMGPWATAEPLIRKHLDLAIRAQNHNTELGDAIMARDLPALAEAYRNCASTLRAQAALAEIIAKTLEPGK